MKEKIIKFGCNDTLVGIEAHSEKSAVASVIMINSGIVHRIGANRMTVDFSRQLNKSGYNTLRFDLSGIGDSLDGTQKMGWKESSIRDISSSIDLMSKRPSVDNIILYGNCGGAAKAFWTIQRRCSQVAGMIFTNPPPLPSDIYFDDKTGKLKEGWQTHESILAKELGDLFEKGVRALFLYSQNDIGEKYFNVRLKPYLQPYIDSKVLTVDVIPLTNHTFATLSAKKAVIDISTNWLQLHFEY